MALSPIGHGSILQVVHGSSVGMVSVPDSFPNPLTNCPHISPEEIESISVGLLLTNNVLHQGFVYKRANSRRTDRMTESVDNMLPIRLQILNRWQLRYVIIYSHYVVYYKDDTGKKPVGWFSLKDYNRVVRAEEMVSADRKWPFKIIGMRSSARTWYFCAPSEREMKLWMACFKATMDHAIHGKVKQTCLDIISKEQQRISPDGDDSLTSASSTGSGGSDRFFQDDDTYDDLESPTTNMENEDDGNYDDIDSEDESGYSGGGDGSSGSGGRCHPQLTGVSSEENYDYPGPERQPPEPPMRPLLPSPDEATRILQNLTKQFPTIPRTPHPDRAETGLRRQGPDGDSFRHKVLPEERRKQPPPSPRPRPPNKPGKLSDLKPAAPPKPRVATKKPKDLLPKSAFLDSADKDYANELLRKHRHSGMYLIRGSARDPSKKVVMVWDQMTEKAKHYTVFGDQKTSFALDQNAQFGSLHELLEFYSKNFLPNTNFKLTRPCPG